MFLPLIAYAALGTEATLGAGVGMATLTRIKAEFRRSDGLYVEKLGETTPAFNWGVGVLMVAMCSAARRDPSWKAELRSYIKATQVYWNPSGPVAGYDVLPMPKKNDRFYDDNAWMVLALVEASDVLQDPAPMQDAERALTFVLSGLDQKLGGGIYWREEEKTSKNTCSNGPSAAACLAVYEKTKRPELLATAKSLYDWTKSKLQDPTDELYWDNLNLNGKIDKTKWSYNTALMITTAAKLGRLTGESRYADDAERMSKASVKKWVVEGKLADEGKFAFLLADSLREVPNDERQASVRLALQWLVKSGRNSDGWFGHRFDRAASARGDVNLIDQAAAARALLQEGL